MTGNPATGDGHLQGHNPLFPRLRDRGLRADRLMVAVLPNLGAPLLGMDVLGRLHFSQKPGELRIDVERLRIPLPRELDDPGLGHGHAAAHETVADLEIFVVAIGHATSSQPYRNGHSGADCVESETSGAQVFSRRLC